MAVHMGSKRRVSLDNFLARLLEITPCYQ
ncbi:hypothetical protein LINGRAHAP2_LOCUS29115 [Linum grandiflorum]